ncbi:NifU family protein [Arthrobacter sp. NPDC056727]|uniref:NifU family protein n=1 Tax=Arthrobacter sp. NPDC056727 TaxID=3345927 RepID=UPI00367299E1
MLGGDRPPPQSGDQIGTLLDALGAGGAVARGRAEDLVRQVTDLYGAGLQRIMEILQAQGKLDDATLDALTADSLVAGLLVIHGLHPHSLEARVAAALDSVRPYLGSHGGDVELEGISPDGVVRLKLLGTCQGCPSSSVTLKYAVEEAIQNAAPEVTAIDVVEAEKQPGAPALIPVDSLLVRVNSPAGGTPAESWHELSGGTWEPVPEIAGLEAGEVAGFLVGGYPVLACRTGQDIYAYRDYCPRCTGSMAGAVLQRALAAPVGGGLLTCPTCRGHFDVRRAGVCLEDRSLHLEPLPLLVRNGVMSVAVPTVSLPSVPVQVPPAPAPLTPVQALPLVALPGLELPAEPGPPVNEPAPNEPAVKEQPANEPAAKEPAASAARSVAAASVAAASVLAASVVGVAPAGSTPPASAAVTAPPAAAPAPQAAAGQDR